MRAKSNKPPKRWVPPEDEVMRRMFPGWGERLRKTPFVGNPPSGVARAVAEEVEAREESGK